MKKNFLYLQIAIGIFFSAETFAQVKPGSESYWVVESNIKTPKHSMVYFYSTNHEVMYKETIDGKRLNVNRQKIRRKLNEALHDVTLVWQKDMQFKIDDFLVTKMFRRN